MTLQQSQDMQDLQWPSWTDMQRESVDLDWFYMSVSKNKGFYPKSSISIGFSIIFTIHLGAYPYFWKHPYKVT